MKLKLKVLLVVFTISCCNNKQASHKPGKPVDIVVMVRDPGVWYFLIFSDKYRRSDTVELNKVKNFEIFDSTIKYHKIQVIDSNNKRIDSLMVFVSFSEPVGFKVFQFYYPLKPTNPKNFEADDSNYVIEYEGIKQLDSIIQQTLRSR